MCSAEVRFMFTTIIHVYAEEATDRNQFQPPGICIPIIPANIYWALAILIILIEAMLPWIQMRHIILWRRRRRITKWECLCKSVNTQSDAHKPPSPCKNTSHLLHCIPSRDRDHTARSTITPLPPLCIYHSETNGLLVVWHFNEP